MRLLLVEDDPELAQLLLRGLRKRGYAIDAVATCREATDRAIENSYDLVILDLMLPDGSGVDLLLSWRREGASFPILILTARDSVEEKVRSLDAGADDYLTKPFEFEELVARVRVLLRRCGAPPEQVLKFEDVELDRTSLGVRRGSTEIELTPKELALLEYLMLHPKRVLTREQIAEHVWDDRYEARSNVIDVIIGRLRRKLESAGGSRLIFTIKGLGYVLQHPAAPDDDSF